MSRRCSDLVMDLYRRCFQHCQCWRVSALTMRAGILKSDDLSFTQIKMLLQMIEKDLIMIRVLWKLEMPPASLLLNFQWPHLLKQPISRPLFERYPPQKKISHV